VNENENVDASAQANLSATLEERRVSAAKSGEKKKWR
jgi:hypothetical protein